MARKLYYKVPENTLNQLSEGEWEEVQRLQHWYNSEFMWTAGKLNFRNSVIFPNVDLNDEEGTLLWVRIRERKQQLCALGLPEPEVIRVLKDEGLIIVKKGGYYDGCLASGFTRVAANEWNAYLVCDFLLKVSRIATRATIEVFDEGAFIKSKAVKISNGSVTVVLTDERRRPYLEAMIEHQHVFAVVDPSKYDQFPVLKSTVANFNDLERSEQNGILKNWNWLGFEGNFDINGDDVRGLDLNKKVSGFYLDPPPAECP